MEDEQQEETQPIATKEEEREWKPITLVFRDQELRDKIEDIRSNTLITSIAVWSFMIGGIVGYIGKLVYSYFPKLDTTGGI